MPILSVLLGVAIITLDISLTSTALPTVSIGLNAAPATTIWIVNIYYLAVAAALLPMAALGEIVGHRKVFLAGLLVFAAGSLLSGLSNSLGMLMCGRTLVGIGAASVSATTPALIRSIYPAERLGRGLGVYAMVVGIAFTIGPTAASGMLSIASWPWLFWQSVPIALAAFAFALAGLPETPRLTRKFDGVAASLCALCFASLLFGIAGAAQIGWQAGVASCLVALTAGLLLHRWDVRNDVPIMATDLFRSSLFALSAATSICSFAVQGAAFVVLPFLFKFEMGYSQVQAGFLITPWPVALVVMTLVAPRLAEHIKPGILGFAGMLIAAIGLVLVATMPLTAGVSDIAWRLLVCGIGFGFFQSPNMLAMMTSAPRERSGGAGGILATSRLVGQAIGAASVAFCLSTWPHAGIWAAIWLSAGFAAIGAAISISRLLPSVRGG